MKSNDILYSRGNNDECYTPDYVVEAILPYLDKSKVYWLPFDRDDSAFVRVLKVNGFKYINSHIDYGQNYYEFEPAHWDAMLSNPPFTNKRLIFERALQLGRPFALLMSNTWLNDAAPKDLFMNKDLQLLMFRNRIKFTNNGVVNNKITFSTSYYCYNFLPKQILMVNK
jgi:hypothetical protein